eukprot:scaffold280945_cov32-Tisochrysis_lutea.AAC.3
MVRDTSAFAPRRAVWPLPEQAQLATTRVAGRLRSVRVEYRTLVDCGTCARTSRYTKATLPPRAQKLLFQGQPRRRDGRKA